MLACSLAPIGVLPPGMHAPTAKTELALRDTPEGAYEVVVLGPRTSALYYRPRGRPLAPRLPLRLGQAEALLGVPATEFTDRTVPLSLLRDVEPLTSYEDWHATLAQAPPGRTRWVDAAARKLVTSRTVAAAARDLGVSERHLRTRFSAAVGVSPKQFARIERVRRVLARLGEAPWAELAVESGFYDQSHLGSEFRRLMGVSPAAFAAGTRPTPQTCTD